MPSSPLPKEKKKIPCVLIVEEQNNMALKTFLLIFSSSTCTLTVICEVFGLVKDCKLLSTCTQGEFLTLQTEDVFRNRLPCKLTNSHLHKPKKITVINVIIWLRKDHPQRIMNQIQQLSWFIDELLCKATITSFFFFSDTVEPLLTVTSLQQPSLYNSHYFGGHPYINSCLNLSTTGTSLQLHIVWQTSIYKLLLKPLYNGDFLLPPRTAPL